MCGIAGYIGKEKIDEGRIRSTLAVMNNRGPDHRDLKTFNLDQGNVYLLHSRLSIIDLDPRAHQPFCIGPYTLIFNGEIYNYKEVRQDLVATGVVFETESDTEVLLRAYIAYGQECVQKFEGMWSFAIYDNHTKQLFLSRDRFAEKPLYLFETEDGLYFGSQTSFLKTLSGRRIAINKRHLLRYMVNGYKALHKTKDTFYEGVEALPFASNLTINLTGQSKIQRYWDPGFFPVKMTEAEAIEGTRHYLKESMKIRLRSDVPMAFCLSGGVDSASLASIAAKEFQYDVATFSIIDSDQRYNEYDNIKATIDDIGCKHTLIELSYDDTFSKLTDLIRYHDAPIGTITYLVHSFLSQEIAKNGYKVAFSGTAADELYTGYYDHFNLHLYEMRHAAAYPQLLADWQEHTGKFVRNPYFKNPELYFKDPTVRDHVYLNNDEFASYLKEDFQEEFGESEYSDCLLRNRMMNELFHECTPVVLQEDDLNSMKYSIENRSPYLDTNLFKFAYSIPNELLIKDGYAKYILREAMSGILNDQVRCDRQKKGFNASINSIIDFDNEDDMSALLADSPIYELVDKEKIAQVAARKPLPNSFSKFLFNFINAKIFLELNQQESAADLTKENR